MIRSHLRLCAIPNRGCQNMRKFYYRNWGRARLTGCRTLMARWKSRGRYRRVYRMCCSMVLRVLLLAWRRIFCRTICAKSPVPVFICWMIQKRQSKICVCMYVGRIFRLKRKLLPRAMNYWRCITRVMAVCVRVPSMKLKMAI